MHAVGRVTRIGRERIARPGISTKAPIRHLDPVLVLSCLGLTAFGLLMVYSASFSSLRDQGFPERHLLDRQIAFAVAGMVIALALTIVSYRRFKTWSLAIFGAALVLLTAALTPFGRSASGAQRWINVGFLQLQPSEIMKIAVVLLLAAFLSERRGEPRLPHAIVACALVAVPAILIYRQPDLGTLLVLVAVLFGVLLVAGARVRLLALMLVVGAVAFWGILHLDLLKEYQVARLTGFLDPSEDLQRTGYNLNQAIIAVASGQMTGKGLFHGTQTNLDFVPEQHTDFIFTAVGEETGFVGSAVLLGLFGLFLWRGVRIAMLSKDLFGTLVAAGVVTMIAFQVFVNVGMTVGISPITGIPLPFVSYGGSSLITTFVATGLLLNVHMRRL